MPSAPDNLRHNVARLQQEVASVTSAADAPAREAHRQLAIRYCERALGLLSDPSLLQVGPSA
jgi:anti-sigma factor RsiW